MAQGTDRIFTSHQESIATAIALCDDSQSAIIANLVDVELFDPPFDDLVARCLEHRRQYGRPPGKGHIDDVLAHVFDDKQHKSYGQYDLIVSKMVQQADKLDTQYVLDEVVEFVQSRRMRGELAQAVERYQRGGERVLDDIEAILRRGLQVRNQHRVRDYGFTLADDRALNFLDQDPTDYCLVGIKELDERRVVPTKKELFAFLSPPNRGKSFWLIHCGKMALLKGWSVVHYTLENSDDMTAQRYMQALFGGVRHQGIYRTTVLESAGEGLVDLKSQTIKPAFVIDDRDKTVKFLSAKMREWNSKLANLRIRRFPSGRLTYEMLEQDLDELKIVHGVEPDLVMVDMPQLMKLPKREKDYSALEELFTNLRGTAVERNLAMVVPQQGNRGSNAAASVRAQHGAGAFGVFGIADNELTYSQTDSEEKHGLARLYLQKVRNNRARTTVAITQHYETGQFVMSSHPMTDKLREDIKAYTGYKPGGGAEDDDEYETTKRVRA